MRPDWIIENSGASSELEIQRILKCITWPRTDRDSVKIRPSSRLRWIFAIDFRHDLSLLSFTSSLPPFFPTSLSLSLSQHLSLAPLPAPLSHHVSASPERHPPGGTWRQFPRRTRVARVRCSKTIGRQSDAEDAKNNVIREEGWEGHWAGRTGVS